MAASDRAARLVTQTEHFLVVDDFLPKAEQVSVWNHFQCQPFRRVEELGFQGHWLLEDAAVLRGPSVGYAHARDACYPTQTPLDSVMSRFVDLSEHFAPLLGAFGEAWDDFTAQMSLHPAGTGLVWHRDSEENVGGYIAFAHAKWNAEWGGELLFPAVVSIPKERRIFFHPLAKVEKAAELAIPAHLDNEDASELLMRRGLGFFVAPKPNRLVVIRGGTPHAIAKVRPSAGRQIRASVTGFIKRKA